MSQADWSNTSPVWMAEASSTTVGIIGRSANVSYRLCRDYPYPQFRCLLSPNHKVQHKKFRRLTGLFRKVVLCNLCWEKRIYVYRICMYVYIHKWRQGKSTYVVGGLQSSIRGVTSLIFTIQVIQLLTKTLCYGNRKYPDLRPI